MPRVSKSKQRPCNYCGKDRSVKNFGRDSDPNTCNFCHIADRAAQIGSPENRLKATKVIAAAA